MPIHRQVRLHADSRVLWPEHKGLDEVLELKRSTPLSVWQATYQGSLAQPSGNIFKREWFENRYDPSSLHRIARWISFDTASSVANDAAYTAWVVGDLLADYRLAIAEIGRKKVEFPQLIGLIRELYTKYYAGGLLRNIVIEDKSSGISALQTLRQASDMSNVLVGFSPKVDKETRWSNASVWCSLGCVLLPPPGEPWLFEAEEEIFTVPGAQNLDQADALSQLILFLEPYLSAGLTARSKQ